MRPNPEKWRLVYPLQDTGQEHGIHAASDKSLTHRALLFAAMAQGTSEIIYPLLGADCRSTMSCLQALGVNIDILYTSARSHFLRVHSPGLDHLQAPSTTLDCGNSGTTARLLCGLLAAIPGMQATLSGDASLSRRPMARITEPLRRMGAALHCAPSETLPLEISGRSLGGGRFNIATASAQVKSALLLASLSSTEPIEIELPPGARDHTELLLQRLGADLTVEQQAAHELIHFQGPFRPPAHNYQIPVDPSAAAFFAVLGLLRSQGKVTLSKVLANSTRTGFIEVLQRMAPDAIQIHPESDSAAYMEAVLRLEVSGGRRLVGTTIQALELPRLIDEIPILAVAAATASGPSVFHGLAELRVKESDRLRLTFELLQAAGAEAQILGDSLHIAGSLKPFRAFRFDPALDHRLAMAAAVLATLGQEASGIADPECVSVSFPEFFSELDPFTARPV